MQNFSSLALKLREEFEETDRWTTCLKIYCSKNSNFACSRRMNIAQKIMIIDYVMAAYIYE